MSESPVDWAITQLHGVIRELRQRENTRLAIETQHLPQVLCERRDPHSAHRDDYTYCPGRHGHARD